MHDWLTPEGSLAALFAASFLAATLVPLSSEAALVAVLKFDPGLLWPALLVASAGNTAGGMTTYAIGRLFGERRPLPQLERVRRFGAPVLAFAWLPAIGDGLVLAAGWLKVHWVQAIVWQAAGRMARYWAVGQLVAG